MKIYAVCVMDDTEPITVSYHTSLSEAEEQRTLLSPAEIIEYDKDTTLTLTPRETLLLQRGLDYYRWFGKRTYEEAKECFSIQERLRNLCKPSKRETPDDSV